MSLEKWEKACELVNFLEVQDGGCHFLSDLQEARQRISPRIQGMLGYSASELAAMGTRIWDCVALPQHVENLRHWRMLLPLQLEDRGVEGFRFVVSFTALTKTAVQLRLHYESCYWYEPQPEGDGRPWAKWVVLRPDPAPVQDEFYGVVCRNVDNSILPQWSYQQGAHSDQPRLSRREQEILRYCSLGYASKETAALLKISLNTVHNHRRAILEKLDAANMADAVRIGTSQAFL